MLNEKDTLKGYIRQLLHAFLLNDNEMLSYYPASPLAMRLFSSTPTRLTKTKVPLSAHHQLAIIKSADALHSLVWHTSAENLKKAVRFGIIEPQALTAKVVSALGHYRLIVAERANSRGIVSSLYSQKIVLLTICQTACEALQTIECCTLNYANELTLAENKDKIQRALNSYQQSITTLSANSEQQLSTVAIYDRLATTTLKNHFDQCIEATKQLKQQLASPQLTIDALRNDILAPHGTKSLHAFIKQRMILVLRLIQGLNQNICYSSSSHALLRGDFNSVIEDGLKCIADDCLHLDPINPILNAHQGRFHPGLHAYYFEHQGQAGKQLREQLLAISHIEGKDSIQFNNSQSRYELVSQLKATTVTSVLQSTPASKWAMNASLVYSAKRALAWLWNVISGITLGLSIDLFIGFLTGLSGYKLPSLAALARIEVMPTCRANTFFTELNQVIPHRHYSLGTLVGSALSRFVQNIAIDLWKSASTSARQYKFELWDNLIADFRFGHQLACDDAAIIQRFCQAIKKLAAKEQAIYQTLSRQYPHQPMPKIHPPVSRFATPAYALTPGEWNDVTNACVRGIGVVHKTFTDAIHSKHPFTGLIFNASYITGLLAVLTPDTLSFLPTSYLTFCKVLGEGLSHGRWPAAVASGFTQAKVFAAGIEAGLHGRNSWLAMGGRLFEKEPSDILVYMILAVSLGATIAFELNIPWLSEKIQHEMGNFPIAALGFAGAKIGILLIDFLKAPVDRPWQQDTHQLANAISLALADLGKSNTECQQLAKTLSSTQHLCALYQQQSALADVDKTLLKRFLLCQQLAQHWHLLEALPHQVKREMQLLLSKQFTSERHALNTLHQQLKPHFPQSIFVVTVTTLLNYIPLLLRNLLILITWSKIPLIDLSEKLAKDIARLTTAATRLLCTLSRLVIVLSRGFFDIIANEIIARTNSYSLGNHHPISDANYQHSAQFDSQQESIYHAVNHYPAKLNQHVSHLAPNVLFNNVGKQIGKHQWSFFSAKSPSTIAKYQPPASSITALLR